MRKEIKVLLILCAFLLSFAVLSFSQQFAPNYKWQDTSGPYGCDATSFFVDKAGNYWLGTGSSGVGGNPAGSYNKKNASSVVMLYKQKESINYIEET
jgi:hypothetical protein